MDEWMNGLDAIQETKELTSESAKEYARHIQQMGSRLHIPEKVRCYATALRAARVRLH